ncbi:AAA family ATPase [Micromonospora sp. NPDC051006]|uniref:AAA family ATPase n=1 Tax=Micromonospora sp. NPDC051006 TaxID=3364283 RepID=UPI0037B94C8A
MTELVPGASSEIVAVKVGAYKGLREQWVQWSDGLALFGVNGAGKTNFLEALAILMGTRETVRLASGRLAEARQGSLELLVRTSADELPWAPNTALNHEMQQFALTFGKNAARLSRIPSDAAWWDTVGIREGDTFFDALRRLNPSNAVSEYLAVQCQRPIVRYTLQRFAIEPSGDISRRFTRTLVGVRTDQALLSEVKAALRPIVSRLGAQPARQGFRHHTDLLPLPETHTAPAHLEWLPRRRDWDEVVEYLRAEFRPALPLAMELAESLSLLIDTGNADADPHWWLHSVAARHAMVELAVTAPGVQVKPRGEDDADLVVTETHRPQQDIWVDDERKTLEQLSAGQRRWADEALATAARSLAEFTRQAAWRASVLRSLDTADLAPVIAPIENEVRSALKSFGFWTSEAKDQVLDAIDSTLVTAARRQLAEWDDEGRRAIWQAAQDLSGLQPQLTIRVIDEPEAHLHPKAQRGTARALEDLRRAGQNIVVASHSPHFLELTSWQVIHVLRRNGATILSPLAPGDLQVGSAFARDLGLSRGELFTAISLILIVEGDHDQLILESLYRERLHRAGVAMIRMRGTNQLINVAQLDFIEQHLDIPVAVLLDYSRPDEVDDGVSDERRTEERKLQEFRKACKLRQRHVKDFALMRPDIIAYLNEDAIRHDVQNFPGWHPVLDHFETLRPRPSFKHWLRVEYGVDLRTTARIQALVQRMIEAGLPAHPDLESAVDDVVCFAQQGR